MIDNNTKDLLLKIKALADQGIGGEKLNAQALLEKKIKQLGITISELESILSENKIKLHNFQYKKSDYDKSIDISYFFRSIASQLFHVKFKKEGTAIYSFNKKNFYAVDLSISDYIQYRIEIDLYVNSFVKDLKVFEYSFFLKNNLLKKSSETNFKPSEEDLKMHENALKMSKGVSYVSTNKMIDKT